MATLSRVPAPRSPFQGWSGRAIALVAVGICVAIAKPWNPPPPSPPPRPSITPAPASSAFPATATRLYDSSGFGGTPPAPAWEIWAAGRVTRVRFVGPSDGFNPGAPPPGEPGATVTVGGPVIELGSADDVAAIGINRPADMELAAVRLWRFRDGNKPERIPILELPPPWAASHFRVFARRDARLAPDTVFRWQPGLYRLDLLIDPADRIRSLLLVVRDGVEPLPDEPANRERTTVDLALLRRLPDAANFWSYGTFLTGWAERDPAVDCDVSEIWRASDIDDACHPISVGRPQALGVNLAGGPVVTGIRLQEIDPLPGPVAVREQTDVRGRPGLAYVSLQRQVFPDGIYRLDVETAVAPLRWYVEVGAHSIDWSP